MIYFICFVFLAVVVYNIYLQIHEVKQNKVIKQLKKDNSLLVQKLDVLHSSNKDTSDSK